MKKIYWMLCVLSFSVTIFAQNIIPSPKVIKQNGVEKYPVKSVKTNKMATVSVDEYYLTIQQGNVVIAGNEIWAKQTLLQLTDDQGCVPDVEIHDWAAYPMRGFMHDCGRNFQTIEMLKETIQWMSFYKFNVFHWHLTDHPAWRIECKIYPQLNDPQYQRQGRDVGKFYTYDEIRELIQFARERGITVVPEIDMPGHSTFFTKTFGFSMDSDEGKAVLEKCLDEFFAEIPVDLAPCFHIGSDEIHIADPQGFMQWAENLMKKYHRIPIAWDPGLPTSTTTFRQIWNEAAGSNAASTKKEGKYLDSFVGYLNYYDPMVYTHRAFLHQACAQAIPDTSVATGGILCLWNDVRVDDKNKIALHNGMMNGMMAFAERFWQGGSAGSIEHANLLPSPQSKTGQKVAAFERKMQFHRDHFLKDVDVRWVANANIPWKIKVENNGWKKAWGGAIEMDAFCENNKIERLDSMQAWATTNIYVDQDTVIRAWIGFEAAARSNRISGGIGKQGRWENNGRVIVNQTIEIFPPVAWNEPEKYNYHFNTWTRPQEEEPYTNEQFYWMREPAFIPLKKGWNSIEMYIPRTFNGQRWSFAFIPVSMKNNGHVGEVEHLRWK
ncbi:MAG: family 20 glycosylhydrolase [Bacteroidales bacterium]|nr:family 20 glycosylhydrolase [Bacteroidales bacterium]